jgi:autotransporter-associated beta strand protein
MHAPTSAFRGLALWILASGGVLLINHGPAQAQSGTWTSLTSGDYNTATNWAGNQVASGAGNSADFSTLNLAGDVSVTLNNPLTIGNLLFGDTNTATGGSWELRTDNIATAIITLDNGAAKPNITVNPLVPATTFDDAFIAHSLAGTMGFNKLGAGTLTLGAGTTNSITGGINVEAGTLRLLGAVPVQAIVLADGTTLATDVTVRNGTVEPGASVTVRSTAAGTVGIGGIMGAGTGESMNLHILGAGRVDLQQDWTGFNNFTISGEDDGTQRGLRLNINDGGNSANGNLWQNAHLHLDNVNVFVRTNSFGNTIPIAELTGTATASLAGGNAGSAARYEIGSANTSSTFAGSINGAGGISINKVGTGTLTLSGAIVGDATNNSLAIAGTPARQGGVIRVSAGTLAILGATSIPGGFGTTLTTIDVLDGATFDVSGAAGTFATSALQKVQGSGTIRGNYNHAAGFIQPGDVGAPTAANEGNLSAGVTPTGGTINFNGNLQLNGGAIIYDMTLDPNTGNDLVRVTGTTTLTSGTIVPRFLAGVPTTGTYTVLTSDGGISGSATNITVNIPGRGTDPTPLVQGNSLVFTPLPGGDPLALRWRGNASGTWDIETTSNWVNPSNNADRFFDFDTVTFDDSATNFNVTIPASTFPRPDAILINNSTNAYVFTGAGAIIGPTGLTKTGSGNLTMQVANNFSGPASLAGGGTIDIGSFGSAFGTGTLEIDGVTIVGANTAAGGFANSSVTTVGSSTNVVRMDGTAGSGGAFNVPNLIGGGTLTLTSTVADKWYQLNSTTEFTGTMNLTGADGQTPMHVRLVANSPVAVLNMNDARVSARSGTGGGTSTFSFGELHGDDNTRLRAFEGGSPAVNAIWEIGAANTDSDFAGIIEDGAGSGGTTSVSHVSKVGTGTLTLSGLNTYTGDTTVQEGTLRITNSYLADMADVLIADGATLNLDFTGDDVIDSLYLNGVPQTPGLYGMGAMGASFFAGAGRLQVTTLGAELGIVGDYNSNGVVDAADYVVWRDSVGAAGLSNRDPIIMGAVGQADYDAWQANFGLSLAAGSAAGIANNAVPEPAGWILAVVAVLIVCARYATSPSGRGREVTSG